MNHNDAAVIKLLKLDAEHTRKIKTIEPIIGDCHTLYIDLFDVGLDLLGVPPDIIKEETEHGPTYEFCRDWLSEKWSILAESGTTKQIEAYPGWVRKELRKVIK